MGNPEVRVETIPITTARTYVVSTLTSWEVFNSDAANSIFLNETATATASAAQSTEVAAGQSRVFFFDGGQTPLTVSVIAATAAVVAVIRRETFRSRTLFWLARYASVRVNQAIDLWRRVSATVIQLGPGYTEARADTIDRKTAATGLVIGTNAITNGIRIGGPVAQSGGNVRIASADGTDWLQVVNSGVAHFLNSQAVLNVSDTEVQARAAAAIVQYNGAATDPRHTFNSLYRCRHTPVAGGAISQVLDAAGYVIKSGVVLTVNDFVEITGTDNRVQLATAASTGGIGRVLVGGTGDAGGTVIAVVAIGGIIAQSIVVGGGGATAGLYARPDSGANPTTRLDGASATIEGTIAKTLITAAAGAISDFELHGGL